MLRLYDYRASCNCYKVRLLLSLLGCPYERVPVDIFDGGTLTDEFGAMNPLRTTPVLELGPGRFLTESGAILWYLAEGTPFRPSEPIESAEVVGWLIYEQTDVIPSIGGLRFRLQTGRLRPGDPDALARREAGVQVLTHLNVHLETRDFFVGDEFSIADVALYGYLHRAEEADYDLQLYPALGAWLARVADRPGYVDDVEPYPTNARPGAGRSTYE